MGVPEPREAVEVDLRALLVEVVHAEEPLGQGWPPEAELRLTGVLLYCIVIYVLVELEGKGQIFLHRERGYLDGEHVVAEDRVS